MRPAGPSDTLAPYELLSLLRGAIVGDGFVVCGEPLVELATGALIKHELRLRLPARDASLISSRHFHPVAERFGLMAELDDTLIRCAAAVTAEGDAVAVNIHAQSVCDPRPRPPNRTGAGRYQRRTGADHIRALRGVSH